MALYNFSHDLPHNIGMFGPVRAVRRDMRMLLSLFPLVQEPAAAQTAQDTGILTLLALGLDRHISRASAAATFPPKPQCDLRRLLKVGGLSMTGTVRSTSGRPSWRILVRVGFWAASSGLRVARSRWVSARGLGSPRAMRAAPLRMRRIGQLRLRCVTSGKRLRRCAAFRGGSTSGEGARGGR